MTSNEKNYYDITIKKIESLIDKNNNKEAYTILKEELSAPYIPNNYEKIFSKLFYKVNSKIYINENINPNGIIFSKIPLILRSDSADEITPSFISQIKNINLRNYLSDIKYFMINKKQSNISKSIILEYLIDQKINILIELKYSHGIYNINPSQIQKIHNLKLFENTFLFLKEFLENKNVSMFKQSLTILELYMLNYFPILCDKNDHDPLKLSISICKYIEGLLNTKISCLDFKDKYNINNDNIVKYLDNIRNMKI